MSARLWWNLAEAPQARLNRTSRPLMNPGNLGDRLARVELLAKLLLLRHGPSSASLVRQGLALPLDTLDSLECSCGDEQGTDNIGLLIRAGQGLTCRRATTICQGLNNLSCFCSRHNR
jgi:hypothetical protein